MAAMREIIMNIIVIGLNHHFITHCAAPPIWFNCHVQYYFYRELEGSLSLCNPLMPYHQ